MDEDAKREVAIFRFGVIHDFVSGIELDRGEQQRLIRDKCNRKWSIPYSARSRLTRSTILRWVKRYKDSKGRLESLYPSSRSDRGLSRGMDEETCLALIRLRKESPRATVPMLVETMKKRNLVSNGLRLNLSTVYRFLHQHNLMNPRQGKPVDRRKFEVELPNDLWQSDAMHGPRVEVDGRMRKSYLLAFLDDHSRLVPHGQFYLSERLTSYLNAFEQALLKRGLPRKLYLDNGPAFRSKHLEHITASLGIALIHARPYKPQGRGKIERFFRTVRMQFLPGFKGNTLEELNESFDLWLNEIYHQRKHSSTGQSPFKRFTAHMECLRSAPIELKDYFRKHARRRVAKDRTITLNGKLYEAPVTLIGKQVLLLFHEDQPERVEVVYQQQSYGLLTVLDLNINARVKRNRDSGTDLQMEDKISSYHGGKLWAKERTDQK
jgi:transposase InsO family protein